MRRASIVAAGVGGVWAGAALLVLGLLGVNDLVSEVGGMAGAGAFAGLTMGTYARGWSIVIGGGLGGAVGLLIIALIGGGEILWQLVVLFAVVSATGFIAGYGVVALATGSRQPRR